MPLNCISLDDGCWLLRGTATAARGKGGEKDGRHASNCYLGYPLCTHTDTQTHTNPHKPTHTDTDRDSYSQTRRYSHISCVCCGPLRHIASKPIIFSGLCVAAHRSSMLPYHTYIHTHKHTHIHTHSHYTVLCLFIRYHFTSTVNTGSRRERRACEQMQNFPQRLCVRLCATALSLSRSLFGGDGGGSSARQHATHERKRAFYMCT